MRFNSDGTKEVLAKAGDPLPDGDGTFGSFSGFIAANDDGLVGFLALLDGTAGGAAADIGLFLYDDDLGIVEVAKEGEDFFGLGGDINAISFASAVEEELDGLNNEDQLVFRVTRRNASFQEAIVRFSLFLTGDYDGDGFVSQADLDLVLLNWGDPSPPAPPGWVNQVPEGVIGQEALDNVLLNWGNGTPPLGAVPEPGTAMMLLTAMMTRGSRRRGDAIR